MGGRFANERTAISTVRHCIAWSTGRGGRSCDCDRATSMPRRHGVLMTVYYRAAGCRASKETGRYEARSAPAVAVDRERGLLPRHFWTLRLILGASRMRWSTRQLGIHDRIHLVINISKHFFSAFGNYLQTDILVRMQSYCLNVPGIGMDWMCLEMEHTRLNLCGTASIQHSDSKSSFSQ